MHCILRVVKLKSVGAVAASCRHTFRDFSTPNADPAREALNVSTGAKSTRAVLAALRQRLPGKRRKDAVLCLEYLVTASPAFFAGGKHQRRYFGASLSWLCKLHGTKNVLSAALHLDETTPHMVVYVVPLTSDGRLTAKEFVGGPAKLSRMQSDFHGEVGGKFGLTRGTKGSKAKHQSIQRFYESLNTESAPLPSINPVDHLAAAVGVKTERMVRYDQAAALMQSRATVAGQSTLMHLQDKVALLQHQVERQTFIARREADAARRIAEARRTEGQELRGQVERLRAQLSAAQAEIRGWIARMRQLAARFQGPWSAKAVDDVSSFNHRRTNDAR